ncbi:MAG: hypothetical protein JO133_07660 [Burkholderiaceae bacterium]|nr:hypothetical protein [Burkholderiaceae bacterium]
MKVKITADLLSTMCAAVLASAGLLPAAAYANSAVYEIDMWAGTASGTLNGVPFSNADIQVDFYGDTSTVQSFSVANPPGYQFPTTNGYFNATSSSVTFGIYSFDSGCGCYTTVGTGTFDPSDGMFVSVDNSNEGFGIGSGFLPPSNPNFPGPGVIYPAGLLTGDQPNTFLTDLQSNYVNGNVFQESCYGFPNPPSGQGCPTGPALVTSAGPLVLNQVTVGQGSSVFSVWVSAYAAVQPMSSFNASVTVRPAAASQKTGPGFNDFHVQGSLELGAGGQSVNPATQEVTLRLGKQVFAIPAGSFKWSKESGYTFASKIGAVALRASLTPQGATGYSFQIDGANAPPLADRLPLRLTIGQAVGRTPVKTVRTPVETVDQ